MISAEQNAALHVNEKGFGVRIVEGGSIGVNFDVPIETINISVRQRLVQMMTQQVLW